MDDIDALRARFRALGNIVWSRRRRINFVRQLSTHDCGTAALAMVLGFHGRVVGIDELRQTLPSGRDGVTAAAILRAGRTAGLRGRGVRVELDQIESLPAASILHWGFRHFVVFDRVRGHHVDIVDPASGRRRVSWSEFQRVFTGVALVFEPDDGFEPSSGKPPRHGRRLIRELLSERAVLGRIITISIVAQVLGVALPFFTSVIIDRVVPQRNYSLLLALTLAFCVVQVFNLVIGFIRAQLLVHLRTRVDIRLTLRFIEHLVGLPFSFFQQHSAGDLLVRLSSNASVRDIITSTALSTLIDGTMTIVYFVFLVSASVPLTIVVLAIAAVRLGLLATIRFRQKELVDEAMQNRARAQTCEVEMIAGIETLKAMNLEHKASEQWTNVYVDGLNISIRRARLDATFAALSSIVSMVTTLALTFFSAMLVIDGDMTLGNMIAFGALASGMLTPLNSLVSTGMQLQMLEVYLARIADVMDTPLEQKSQSVVRGVQLIGKIEFENVDFKYPGQTDCVIAECSFQINSGARVAIVGKSGSGKSTLARMLAGLYEPTQGRVLLDSLDMSTLDRSAIRQQLGIVTQDAPLFTGTIRHNIAIADPDMRLEDVKRAAETAVIHDDIRAMPLGYDTLLADRGLSLSGGQRQRIALARAVARRPRILILDEATSHLDSLTESRVNDRLSKLGCTRVVIAHRIATVKDADLILVLERGSIVEQGTHEELLARNGSYAAMVAAHPDPYAMPAQRGFGGSTVRI